MIIFSYLNSIYLKIFLVGQRKGDFLLRLLQSLSFLQLFSWDLLLSLVPFFIAGSKSKRSKVGLKESFFLVITITIMVETMSVLLFLLLVKLWKTIAAQNPCNSTLVPSELQQKTSQMTTCLDREDLVLFTRYKFRF